MRALSAIALVMAFEIAGPGVETRRAAGAGAQSATFPSNPRRLATDNGILLGGLLALGHTPACAIYRPGELPPPYAPLVKGVRALAFVAATGFDLEQLAACRPDGIVTGSGRQGQTSGARYQQVAPTLFVQQPNPPVDAAGVVQSSWKTWFVNLADALGQKGRAASVIANVDRRASALRGHLAGRMLGFLSLGSSSTFSVPNEYLPLTLVYRQDLGMRHLMLPASAFESRCTATPPAPCYSRPQSMEMLTRLSAADALLVQFQGLAADDLRVFKTNPLFASIPAAKAGRVSQTYRYTDIGPVGVGWIYTAIADALGIKEYFAAIGDGAGGGMASVTLDPAARKVCWAITPPRGATSAQPVSLRTSSGSMVLSEPPTYATLEENPAWQTTPPTMQTAGCAAVPVAIQSSWTASPSGVRLSVGGTSTALTPGVPDVANVSMPR